MSLSPIDQIRQANLQLSFSIKLMMHLQLRKIDKDEFDCEAQVNLERRIVPLPANIFHTYEDLISAGENTFMVTLGFHAISIDTALTELGILPNLQVTHPYRDVRDLVYMIRCAFAHNFIDPEWQAKPSFQRKLNIGLPSQLLTVDMLAFNGQRFRIEHVGGVSGYREIVGEIEKIVAAGP
jgi:hypothetical protein